MGIMTLILVLAFILRLVRLNDSFWLDEAAQVLESTRPLAEQLQIAGDFQPPLMHLLTFFWLKFLAIFGLERSELLVRFLPSVIPGLVSVWATYQIALKFWPKTKKDTAKTSAANTGTTKTNATKTSKKNALAFFSALLLATSPLHVYFSQELRPYSLAMMWGCLSLLSLLNLSQDNTLPSLKSAAKAKNSAAANTTNTAASTNTAKIFNKHTLTFIIFNLLGLYSSYLYPFFLLAQLAYLFFVKKIDFKKLLLIVAPIALGFLPWLPKLLEQVRVGQALRQQMPGWAEVVSLPQLKSLLFVPLKFIYGLLDLEVNVFFVATALLIFGLLAYLLFQQRKLKSTKQSVIFFIYFFLAPLLIMWLFSFFIPVLQPKRVLFLMPAFFILISQTVLYAQKKHQPLALLLLFSLFAIHLYALISYWYKPALQRENWRGLVQRIEYNFPSQNAVAVFSFSAPFAPFAYYTDNKFPTFATQSLYLPAETDLANKIKVISDYDYVLLFDYLRDLTDPQDQLPALIKDLSFAEIGLIDYPNIGFVRMYSKESITAYEGGSRCQ